MSEHLSSHAGPGAEERYRRIVETAQEGVITIDVDALIDFVNPVMARMLGHRAEEMIGTPLTAYMDEEGRRLLPYYIERRRNGISEQFDFKLLRRDGTELWTLVSTNPLLDEEGRYSGALAMFTDVTERRETLRFLEWETGALKIVNGKTPVDCMLDSLVTGMEQLLPGTHCSVFLLEGDGSRAGRVAVNTLPAHFIEEGDLQSSPFKPLVDQEKQLIVSDLTIDEWWARCADMIAKHRLTMCYATSILDDQQQVSGILCVFFSKDHAPGSRESKLIGRATRIIELGIGRRLAEEYLKNSQAALEDANERLRLLNEELEHRAMARARQLAALASEITSVEERERLRTADVIHGDLLQILAAARLNLGPLEAQLKPEAGKDALEEVRGLLDQAVHAGQSLIRGLYPPALGYKSLEKAMEWLADQNMAHGLRVKVEVSPQLQLQERERIVLLFRSAAELLANVRRHSRTDTADLKVDQSEDGAARLRVSDDGVGFDPSGLEDREDGGYGLFSLRERVKAFGGTFEIESAPDKGCRATLTVPLSAAQERP